MPILHNISLYGYTDKNKKLIKHQTICKLTQFAYSDFSHGKNITKIFNWNLLKIKNQQYFLKSCHFTRTQFGYFCPVAPVVDCAFYGYLQQNRVW